MCKLISLFYANHYKLINLNKESLIRTRRKHLEDFALVTHPVVVAVEDTVAAGGTFEDSHYQRNHYDYGRAVKEKKSVK